MLDIGFSEILLFGIIALVVLGPEKLPVAIRTAGRWYANLRRLVTNVQRDIEQELKLTEIREQMQQELTKLKDMEHAMQQKLDQLNDMQELHQFPSNQIKPQFEAPPAFGLMLWQHQQAAVRTPYRVTHTTPINPAQTEVAWQLPATANEHPLS